MTQTYIVYIGMLVLGAIFAYRFEMTKHFMWLVAVILLLSFFAGFRGERVGCDTITYYYRIDQIISGQGYLVYGFEESFKKIVEFLGSIIKNSSFVFVVLSLLIYGLFFIRLKDFSNLISFEWTFFSFYCTFFFSSLNAFRQFVAVSIVFFATRYVAKKKYVFFVALILCAFCFHTSGLIGFAYLLLHFSFLKYDTLGKKILAICCVLSFIASYSLFFSYMSKYAYLFGTLNGKGVGGLLIAKIILFIVSYYFCFYSKADYRSDMEKLDLKVASLAYLFGMLMTSMGYFYLFTERICVYFYLFETVYIGMIMKNRSININTMIFGLSYMAISLFSFIMSLNHDEQCQIPYFFVWEYY